MPPLHIAFRNGRQKLTVGQVPLVVGTLSSLAGKFPPPRQKVDCDVVEVRLDKTGPPPDWLERCREIQDRGWPVLLTIRLKNEGGAWNDGDARRLPLFEQGLYELAGADVEWRSNIVHRVAILAKRLRKICVISYHDLNKTPPAEKLAAIILEAQKLASIVKIATRLNNPADEATLRLLLAHRWKRPLCLIGMGPAWTHTRLSFPQLGSCLTYGYLDKPAAPGQMPAAELARQLRAQKPPAVNTQQSKPMVRQSYNSVVS
jgi:3-dehydroquinate dehydratase-1